MRHAALGLLALAGCNEIFDLGRNVALKDAGVVDADPLLPRIWFQAQITRTTTQGYLDPALDYGPLDPPPAIQLGPIDGPLEAAPYGADGTVAYPIALAGKPWRLAYTLGDGVPREVHWSPPEGDLVARIVEPMFGRALRKPVPRGGYRITPVGSPTQHTATRVFTTGIWTEGELVGTSSGATIDYDFGAKARPFSSPLGAPEKAWTDLAVLADFQTANGCRFASGTATFAVPDLVADTFTPPTPQPTYFGPDKQAILSLAGPTPIDSRLSDVLGTRAGGADILRMEYGYVPSLEVFGFARPVPEQVVDFFLPGPQMISFASCTFAPGTGTYQSQVFSDPPDLRSRFPHVVHVEVANRRMRGVVELASGFSAVVASSTYNFTSEFLVAAPTAFTLHRDGSQIANLAADPDGKVLPAGTGRLELRFEVETNSLLAADYFDITLYALSTGKLDRQRVYTVTDRKLTLDPSFLVPGTEYVFEIRAYRGRPDIGRADFASNTYPQYAATIFTRTFMTPP